MQDHQESIYFTKLETTTTVTLIDERSVQHCFDANTSAVTNRSILTKWCIGTGYLKKHSSDASVQRPVPHVVLHLKPARVTWD
jgi:hypothetical protein